MRRLYPLYHAGYANIPSYDALAHPLDRYYHDFLPPQYNRKRQRRQAAAIVVESLWNNNSNNDTGGTKNGSIPTRKSTAQPRPVLTVPPKGIGPIADPNVNDVLCGRGGRINSHAGNVQFRDIIHSKKKAYLAPTTKKLEKAHIAAGIVNDIRTMNPPGRFLKEEKGTLMWYDIGDAKAIKKTGQALREDAPDIRPAIDVDGGSSGDEKKTGVAKSAENTGMVKSSAKSKDNDIPPTVAISPRGRQSRRGSNDTQTTLIPIKRRPQQEYRSNGAQRQMPNSDYHDLMSMPPPYLPQGNNNNAISLQSQQFMQQQSSQNQQGFQTGNIPIQVPVGANRSSFPNQAYSGGQSSSTKFGLTSRKAMEFLNQAVPTMQQQQWNPHGGSSERHPDDPTFGMTFYDPNSREISDDNTISTISGLSEPVSSIRSGRPSGASDLMGGRYSVGTSDLMNMSLKSNFSLTDSMRLRNGVKSCSSQNKTYDQLMQGAIGGSIKSGSNKSYDPMMLATLNGSIKSGFGGSLTRSNSFPDNMSSDSFKFYGDENNLLEEDRSLMGSRRGKSSAMSIGSIMDMQSDASSSNWFQGSLSNLPMPDDKSFMSSAYMSTDLDALDLASTF